MLTEDQQKSDSSCTVQRPQRRALYNKIDGGNRANLLFPRGFSQLAVSLPDVVLRRRFLDAQGLRNS